MMTSPNVAQNTSTVHQADFSSVTIFPLIITGLVLYEWHNYSTLKITNFKKMRRDLPVAMVYVNMAGVIARLSILQGHYDILVP